MITIPACFGHGLNPSFPDYKGTKIGFDCTRPFPYTQDYDRAAYKQVSLDDYGSKAAGGVGSTAVEKWPAGLRRQVLPSQAMPDRPHRRRRGQGRAGAPAAPVASLTRAAGGASATARA